jgi:hypothetical protein
VPNNRDLWQDDPGDEEDEEMTEYEVDPTGVSSDASRQRINELVTNYSDDELGKMVRAALVARQQTEMENDTTLKSFGAWLESVGLGWIVAAADRTVETLSRIWEALKRILS